ncbi:MAG: hypothetical protein DRJ03_03455 [Chloroflexi bacterium]|nr:MAG: hypothetical protein DRJ03_03455 [Chloroflexota bacterium]
MKLALAILGLLTPIATAFVWWVKNKERRKKDRIRKEIKEHEHLLAKALHEKDADSVALHTEHLRRLREEWRYLARR